ncbi:hypothetical protein IW262DRAFT_1468949 [Armillaria fumosa]|nr:hypothetical protein IW262DRAFT_1468949 [Armillaria fumosa]
MSHGGSTRCTPSKDINWLFFDAVNSYSDIHSLQVAGYDAKKILQDHRELWAKEVEKQFRFCADPMTIVFWMPQENLETDSFPDDWIRTTNLTHVVIWQTSTMLFYKALYTDNDKEDQDCVHLIVTAQRQPNDDKLAT